MLHVLVGATDDATPTLEELAADDTDLAAEAQALLDRIRARDAYQRLADKGFQEYMDIGGRGKWNQARIGSPDRRVKVHSI